MGLPRGEYRPDAKGPLDGVRVLDLSRVLVGNVLTQVLADMGADVIKVEPPEGDSLRAWRENGVPVQWKIYGRNKRSLVLDLKRQAHREVLRRLVGTAQVLVENFRPGVLDRLGFTAAALHAIQPRLVIVRITGWGQTGPYRDRPGFGTLVEAMSGFAQKNGFPDRPPVLPNLGLADNIAGLYGASATLVALREVEVKGGPGQEIDLSLIEPMVSVLGGDAAVHHVTGKPPGRHGNRSSVASPRNIYPCRDGSFVSLSASTQEMTERLLRAIGRAELIDDPRFRTNADRLANADALDEVIGGFIGARGLDENLAHFTAAEVTVGPVYDAAQLAADPHVRARGVLQMYPDDEAGGLPMHPVVPRLSRTPGAVRRPAPKLDADAAEILAELGLPEDALKG
jgi:formyl-CoA transferase